MQKGRVHCMELHILGFKTLKKNFESKIFILHHFNQTRSLSFQNLFIGK